MHAAERQLVRFFAVISRDSASRFIHRISAVGYPSFADTRHRHFVPTLSVVPMSSNSDSVHGVVRICWHCGEEAKGARAADEGVVLLCPHCGSLQPLPARIDYFSYFGLDGSPGGATIDETELKRRFRRMQSLVHPDKFARRDERERDLSAQHSAFLNNAYRTLREPFARAEYLLSLLETVQSGGAAASSSSEHLSTDDEGTVEDNETAAEMMELMESIEQMAPDSAQIGQRLVELDLDIYRLLRQANDQMTTQENLPEARQTLRRISYLRRSRRLLEAKRKGE